MRSSWSSWDLAPGVFAWPQPFRRSPCVVDIQPDLILLSVFTLCWYDQVTTAGAITVINMADMHKSFTE